MKALVTGAAGFIGSFLTKELISQGHTIRGLAMPGENASALEKLGVEIRRGDLTQPNSLRGLCNGIDIVFHLAGRVTDWGTKEQFYSAIYDATRNLMEEALGKVPRFVYISSCAALGLGRHLKGLKETDPAFKSGIPYNDAKLDTEKLVMGYHNTGKIACTIIRPVNVTGPGSVWVRDILDKMKNMPLPLVDGGSYSSSMIFVENLVDGIILAGTKDIAKGKIYHLRDDWNVTWKQYITDIGAFIGKKPGPSIPYRLVRPLTWVFDMLCTPLHIRPPVSRMSADIAGRDLDVDNTLAKEELGWRTKVSYQEALMKIEAWVREKYA